MILKLVIDEGVVSSNAKSELIEQILVPVTANNASRTSSSKPKLVPTPLKTCTSRMLAGKASQNVLIVTTCTVETLATWVTTSADTLSKVASFSWGKRSGVMPPRLLISPRFNSWTLERTESIFNWQTSETSNCITCGGNVTSRRSL